MSTNPRRGKAMPTDGPTPKFLYTIIKQLDLRSIDWSLVASQLEISNGHAARMRYARFKQQMEGTVPGSRAARAKKSPSKSKKGYSSKEDMMRESTPAQQEQSQPQQTVKQEPLMCRYEPNPFVKNEPYAQRTLNMAKIPHVSSHMMAHPSGQMLAAPYPHGTVAPVDLAMYPMTPNFGSPAPSKLERPSDQLYDWPPVKLEQEVKSEVHGVPVKQEPKQEPPQDDDEVQFQGMSVVGGTEAIDGRLK
ncbi:hypothetical protein P168DRAFT_317782 [Aspergillus campestris IBT 28561]|uniref:Myb-like DNA-binding domain-containing protein n=1 Tax=Aspergillus campestris (strain IBT 28561) TaxID=1392248 RepID=A0A2I1D4D2_ASPC2|nr:uncharacterized protein P168DRAFT_317782 [Aspergillus campestris IBT 28561]PKY04732.1 hypothetical protein P168DRAFT_317782 [Aspergillus campestris IBT 28561]